MDFVEKFLKNASLKDLIEMRDKWLQMDYDSLTVEKQSFPAKMSGKPVDVFIQERRKGLDNYKTRLEEAIKKRKQ